MEINMRNNQNYNLNETQSAWQNPQNYNGNYNNRNNGKKGGSSNTAVIIIIAILSALLITVVVIGALYFTGRISIGGKTNTNTKTTQEETKTETAVEQPMKAEPVTMYVANVKNSIYFRTAPEENQSNIICEIPLGTAVGFIENSNTVFAKISYNGQEGYVKREYLSNSAPAPAAEPTTATSSAYSGNTTVSSTVYVANVKNSIYLRSEPSEASDANIICTIPLGTGIGFVENTNNTFAKVSYNGKLGYAKREYLSFSAPYQGSSASNQRSSASYMTVCNVKTSIYLRSAPKESSDNIICEIPVGSVVEYLGSGTGEFYKIRWNGKVGYSKSEYLR